MGEAANRGTKEERVAIAVERDEETQEAIENREHNDNLVWLAIEATNSIAAIDKTGAFVIREDDNMIDYVPNESGWRTLRPEDVPEWLKQDQIINDLKNGERVSSEPDNNGTWYRGIVCSPPNSSEGMAH